MRLVALMLVLVAAASPALADEPSSPVVVLRGSSAPPTPWYEPPPQPQVQTVYVPVFYYPVWTSGRFVHRHHHASSQPRSR